MKRYIYPGIVVIALVASSCKTVGVSRERGGYARVSPAVAYQMMVDAREILVIDFRSSEEYLGDQGHIAGAISVPLGAIESKLPELLPYQGSTVLVYSDLKEEGIDGAKLLVASGFRNVVLIRGGLKEWADMGYKTVASR